MTPETQRHRDIETGSLVTCSKREKVLITDRKKRGAGRIICQLESPRPPPLQVVVGEHDGHEP